MKKILVLLLCAALILTMLTACGSGNAPAAPVESNAGSQTAPDDNAEPAQQEVTIHLFHQKQEAQEAFAQIINAFHTEYP